MGEEDGCRVVPLDDDPQSELNVLRRELRRLQASVRDAGLQIASHQDEIIELRKSLTAAEVEVEEGLVRESNLRMQLELQSLKRQQVESTMAAAEALVSSLREMITESERNEADSSGIVDSQLPEPYPRSQFDLRKETGKIGGSKLDQVLKSIADESTRQLQPAEDLSDDLSATLTNECEVQVAQIAFDNLEQKQSESTGNTEPVPKRSSDESKQTASHTGDDLSRPRSYPLVSSAAHRQPVPRATPSVAPQTNTRQTSNLLLSAFRSGPAAIDHQAQAIHSSSIQSGVPLPTEVAAVAKSEGVPSHVMLPSNIALALNDAHSGEVFALASSSDCEWTVSGGDDKIVKVYDRSGTPYAAITENTRAVTALGIQPEPSPQNSDGVVIYCGGSDGAVRAFRRNARRKTRWSLEAVLPVHSQAVRRILVTDKQGMSGSSNLILTCSTDRTIRLCDVEHSRKPFSVTSPSAVLDVASFGTRAGGLIVSGHKDGALRLWSSRDGNAMVGGAKVHTKGVTSVSCLDDGQSLVSLGRDNVIRLSDIRMNIAIVREMEGMVHTVSDWHRAAAYGRHVACGSGKQGNLGIWNVDTGKLVRRVSSQVLDPDADVLDMVARKLRNPGCVVMPLWTANGQFICAHRTRQVSFWNCA